MFVRIQGGPAEKVVSDVLFAMTLLAALPLGLLLLLAIPIGPVCATFRRRPDRLVGEVFGPWAAWSCHRPGASGGRCSRWAGPLLGASQVRVKLSTAAVHCRFGTGPGASTRSDSGSGASNTFTLKASLASLPSASRAVTVDDRFGPFWGCTEHGIDQSCRYENNIGRGTARRRG